MKKIILPLLLLCAIGHVFAQTTVNLKKDLNALTEIERLEITKSALKSLKDKEATLVVRLPSNQKKMMELERLAKSKDLTPQKAQRMEEVLQSTRAITPAFNIRLMTAFDENFEFCDILFIYDHASKDLKNRKTKGIFLDKRVQPDPSIQLKTNEYFILSIDYDGFPEAMNINDFDTLNSDLDKLPKPYPQYARASIFFNLNLLLLKDDGEKQVKVMNKMTEKYNKKLNKAYSKYF